MCRRLTANSPKFPVFSLFNRESEPETGSLETASSAILIHCFNCITCLWRRPEMPPDLRAFPAMDRVSWSAETTS
jgi:hypothetical protein